MADILRVTGGAVSVLPSTTFAAPTTAIFDSEDRNDGSAYTFTQSSATITLPSTGLADGYLLIASVHFGDTSNGRVSIAGRFQQISGTGNFVNGQSGGFSRNTNNNECYHNCWAFVDNPSASATFQYQWERESDAPTGGTVKSDLEVIPLFYSNHGIYSGSSATLMGGTTRNVVPIGSTVNESDTAAIERATNVVTVKGDNKRYMVLSSQWYQDRGEPSTTRTQRIFGHDYDGSADLAAQSYGYYRQGSADGTGGIIHDLIETVTANRTIEMTCYRGDGVTNGDGGADVDGQAPSQAVTALVVLELNDSAEVFRSNDSTGLQALDSATPLDLNASRTTDFIDAGSWAKVNDVETENAAGITIDALTGANIWAASTDVGSGTRGQYQGNIIVAEVEDPDIFHGNYIRGNQGSEDTFGFATNPIGHVSLGIDVDLGVSVTQAGETHATDTQAGTVGFWGINLDTLEGGSSPQTISVGLVTETDLAQAITIATTLTLAVGLATETDLAQAVTVSPSNTIVIGQALETDLAQAVTLSTGNTNISAGQVNETDLAQATTVATALALAINQAAETDLAQPITVGGSIGISIGQVTETDLAQPVMVASPFEIVLSSNVATGGENTTDRLTGGNTHGGGRITDDQNPSNSIDLATDESGEWAFVIQGTDAAEAGEQYSFRLVISPSTELGSYGVEPKWTIGSGVTISTGQVTETDLAQPVTVGIGAIGISTGQVFETDLSQPVTAGLTTTVVTGQVLETDLAQAVTVGIGAIGVSTGQVNETDLAQPVTVGIGAISAIVGQALETDLAQPVTFSQAEIVSVGQTLETDLAQPVTVGVGAVSVIVGQVLESDLSQPVNVGASITVVVGQAQETDLAQSVTVGIGAVSIVVGQVQETDLAQPVTFTTGVTTISTGQAQETDLAQPVTVASPITVSIGQTLETDLAQPITVASVIGISVGQPIETDLAQPVTAGLSIGVATGQALETDLAQPVTVGSAIGITVGQVIETDLAQSVTPVTGAVSISIGQVTETDLAQPVDVGIGGVISINQVFETDLAQSVTALPVITVAIGQTQETDLAQPVTVELGTTIVIGQVQETDVAQPITVTIEPITIQVGQVVETDLAQSVTVVPVISVVIGQVTETDLAQPVTIGIGAVTITVGQVTETDLAQPLEVFLGRLVNCTLVDRFGDVLPNLTALSWAWFDAVDPVDFIAPSDTGETESTDGTGYIEVIIPSTLLTPGQSGTLVLRSNDGTLIGAYNLEVV